MKISEYGRKELDDLKKYPRIYVLAFVDYLHMALQRKYKAQKDSAAAKYQLSVSEWSDVSSVIRCASDEELYSLYEDAIKIAEEDEKKL